MQSVSSSFGRQIAEGAILAILVSLLLVAIYISFRFQPKFAGPVMVSLLHDVLITVGIYALLGTGGDDRHGRRGPDRARVLDLRHDHHSRPSPGEHPADEAGVVPDARERVAVGDDPALSRDDVHHAAADHGALLSSAARR